MPLFLKKDLPLNKTSLLLWKADESTDELRSLAQIRKSDQSRYESIQLEKRKREWLCVKILLNDFVANEELSNMMNGKPLLSGGLHISISHCDDLAGIIISGKNVGLDIQRFDKKIPNIARRFCNQEELDHNMLASDRNEHLTIMWSVKEAIFKFYGEKVNFANDIHIRKFDVDDKVINVLYQGIHGEQDFSVAHEKHENFHILYTE